MKLKEKIRAKLDSNERTRKLLDYEFRTIFFTVVSLVITTGYAAFYAVLGFTLSSVWYGVLASYYILIVVMRAVVVFYHKGKKKRKETCDEYKENISRAKIYRGCGIVIGSLTLPLSFAIMMMVGEKATFSHAGLMIYVAATYTTYKVVMTIRHLVKARKSADLTVRTVRSINLADMFVSILALQTAMFNSFSPNADYSVFNAVTGAAVCLATVMIGVFMVVGGNRAVTQINYQKNLQSKEMRDNT